MLWCRHWALSTGQLRPTKDIVTHKHYFLPINYRCYWWRRGTDPHPSPHCHSALGKPSRKEEGRDLRGVARHHTCTVLRVEQRSIHGLQIGHGTVRLAVCHLQIRCHDERKNMAVPWEENTTFWWGSGNSMGELEVGC